MKSCPRPLTVASSPRLLQVGGPWAWGLSWGRRAALTTQGGGDAGRESSVSSQGGWGRVAVWNVDVGCRWRDVPGCKCTAYKGIHIRWKCRVFAVVRMLGPFNFVHRCKLLSCLLLLLLVLKYQDNFLHQSIYKRQQTENRNLPRYQPQMKPRVEDPKENPTH